jgi:hypothetical protein
MPRVPPGHDGTRPAEPFTGYGNSIHRLGDVPVGNQIAKLAGTEPVRREAKQSDGDQTDEANTFSQLGRRIWTLGDAVCSRAVEFPFASVSVILEVCSSVDVVRR